jgi:hypothetical protein
MHTYKYLMLFAVLISGITAASLQSARDAACVQPTDCVTDDQCCLGTLCGDDQVCKVDLSSDVHKI